MFGYGVVYDEWFFESSLHESGFGADTVAKLGEKGYTYEQDGALWLKTAQILGENLLKAGKKQEEIKKAFLDKFMPYIEKIDKEEHGYKNRVLARHYASVFLSHMKNHHPIWATIIFFKYFFKSPTIFMSVVSNRFIIHYKNNK